MPMYYGISVALVSALAMICTAPAQTHGNSVFIDSFIADLGISRTTISACYLFGTCLGGCSQPLVGSLLDSRGCRLVGAAVIGVFGGACFLQSATRNVAMLAVAFLMLRMSGQASLGSCCNLAINQWWVRRRGSVMGPVT